MELSNKVESFPVKISDMELYNDMLNWIRMNEISGWYVRSYAVPHSFYFLKEEDAVLFQLAWG